MTPEFDTISELAEALARYNDLYRKGTPEVSDATYDALVEDLRTRAPDHPFLEKVEPEQFASRKEVRHPAPMLSTEKAYDETALQRFVDRIQKAGDEIGVATVLFRVMPKLDGLAGRDDGQVLASRGNGLVGYDITSAFDKGVIPLGGRGRGLGEIVILSDYFETELSGQFVHPRNMVVGIVSSDVVNEAAQKALTDEAVHFVPYRELDCWEGAGAQMIAEMDQIREALTGQTPYPMDGLVAEVTDDALKAHLGATSHHYRWQVAIKTRGETAVTRVQKITWQVGRTGSITPVMEIEPVSLSGATLRRVTAHNAGLIQKKHIGPGAEIEIIRSGEVIPKLEAVLQPSEEVTLPEACPVCDAPLAWRNDFLKCLNPNCQAQTEQRLRHWFKTLDNADWFGIKTIQKIVAQGHDALEKVYALQEADFVEMGFGPVQSKNLAGALLSSRQRSIEDWRFLAALGIPDLGVGDSRNLLRHFRLEDLPALDEEDIRAIKGFGDITAANIAAGLHQLKETFNHLQSLGFNLTASQEAVPSDDSPIAGKGIVFTGKMIRGNREEMQNKARALGARVQTSVSGATDFLVCGERVGAKKIEKARNLNVKVLSEDQYQDLITP